MSDNENKQTTVEQPKAAGRPQIIITLLPNGQVHAQGPTDMKLMFSMLGIFFKQLGHNVEFKSASPIIQPPPGVVIK